jgi:hypothetical protein
MTTEAEGKNLDKIVVRPFASLVQAGLLSIVGHLRSEATPMTK